MSKTPKKDLIEDLREDGPRKLSVQPFKVNESLVITIDKEAATAAGIDFDNPRTVDEWVYKEEGKIVVDLEQ